MRLRVPISFITAILLGIAGLVFASNPALASNITANQIWSNLTDQYVIGVSGASTADGTQLVTWAPEGHPDQFWRFDSTNHGYQQIVNVNSGKCMGVSGGSTSAGATVVQWTCNGHADQYWRLGRTGGAYGYDTLVNENSGLCVGISSNYTGQGGALVQWACDGNGDKQWIPDSAAWPGGDDMGKPWYACVGGNPGECTSTSDSDPINVVFNDPNGPALTDITGDLEAEGWSTTTCFNPQVQFDSTTGITRPPDAVLATDVSNNGCGPNGGTRDHVRMWVSPDRHTVWMAASLEQTNCVSVACNHSVVSFDAGRNRVISDENNRLPGRVNFISNEVMQYPASSLPASSPVNFTGYVGVFNIGA